MVVIDVNDVYDYLIGWCWYVYLMNYKDIGMMYLIFVIIVGIIGGVLFVGMWMEL